MMRPLAGLALRWPRPLFRLQCAFTTTSRYHKRQRNDRGARVVRRVANKQPDPDPDPDRTFQARKSIIRKEVLNLSRWIVEDVDNPPIIEDAILRLGAAVDNLRYSLEKSTFATKLPPRQRAIPAVYYRGGTSRAVIFLTRHLPQGRAERHDAFLQIMGSPDRHGRQLNGMGAGVSSLSKICLVNPSKHPEADMDYTFVGVGIEGDEVDLNGNCGNMASAIGPFVYNQRMFEPPTTPEEFNTPKQVTMRIINTNTGVIIRSTFAVCQGQAIVDDTTSIDGVSGLGTGVTLDFLRPGGSKTGKLLPTGNAVDIINGVEVSCVDAANPCVFVRASDLDIDPTISPERFLASPFKLHRLEEIRAEAAVMMGFCKRGATPPRVIPKIGIVSPPVQQRILSGDVNHEGTLDLVVRFISDGQPHRAIPLTAALCTAAAAKIPGSLVQQCVRDISVNDGVITIGHPSGRIQVNATMDKKGDVECCSVVRTARRIMEGRVYYTPDQGSLPHSR